MPPRILPKVTLTRRLPQRSARKPRLSIVILFCLLTWLGAWHASRAVALFVTIRLAEDSSRNPFAFTMPIVITRYIRAPEAEKTIVAQKPAVAEAEVPSPTEPMGIVFNAKDELANSGVPIPPVAIAVPPEDDDEHILDDARSLADAGDNQAALALYARVLDHDRDNHAALAGRAFVQTQTGDYSGAIATDHRLLALFPDDAAARSNLIAALGEAATVSASDELNRMLKTNPDSAPIHAAVAKQLARSGNMGQALYHLDRAARAAPNDVLYRADLAIMYDRAGEKEQAIALYQQVLNAGAGRAGNDLPLSLQGIRQRVDYLESTGSNEEGR